MRMGKKRNIGKNAISHRASLESSTVSNKKKSRISHTEICIEERWDTVYVSATELKVSRDEILQKMKSLRNIFGNF